MISVSDIRKKFNKKAQSYTDKELQNILNFAYNLCERIVNQTEAKNYKNKNV